MLSGTFTPYNPQVALIRLFIHPSPHHHHHHHVYLCMSKLLIGPNLIPIYKSEEYTTQQWLYCYSWAITVIENYTYQY